MQRALRRAHVVGGAILPALLILSGVVSAQPPTIQAKVVLITVDAGASDAAWPEAEDAIRRELDLMGLAVETVVLPVEQADAGQAVLRHIARERRAAAAVRLMRSADTEQTAVELWIVDQVTGKTTFRELPVRRGDDSGAAIDAALRTVEALRASLLELRMTVRPQDNAPPEIEKIARETPLSAEDASAEPVEEKGRDRPFPLLGVWLGGGAEWSPGGVTARGAFSMGFLVQPFRGFDIELGAGLSPLGPDVTSRADESVSSFGYTLVRATLLYRFFSRSPLHGAVGVTGGALIGWVEGRDSAGTPLDQDAEASPYLAGTLRGYWFVRKSIALVLGVEVGSLLSAMRLTHGINITAARFGQPIVGGNLALQVRFL